MGDSSRIKVGQKVLAIGNPFGFSRTLTEGIISRVDREKNKIQTDASINPGCSGGPLLNTDGKLSELTSLFTTLITINQTSASGLQFQLTLQKTLSMMRKKINPNYLLLEFDSLILSMALSIPLNNPISITSNNKMLPV